MTDRSQVRYAEVRPLLRSLLQKAVRRGNPKLAEIVACRLAENGDSSWLDTRVGVIAFEECWPYGERLLRQLPLVSLVEMAGLTKNKEAAGLGALAHALAAGDHSVLNVAADPLAVKIVAASLTRTDDFFSWAGRSLGPKENNNFLRIARAYFRRASWPWDKAFASAATYLLCSGQSLELGKASPQLGTISQFPLWVAVDKHTPAGKAALRRTASKLRVNTNQLEWASFYFESARCSDRKEGSWWEIEMAWRLQKIGMKVEEANALWTVAHNFVRNEVAGSCRLLEMTLGAVAD